MALDSTRMEHTNFESAHPPRGFYGWWIVLAGTAILFASSGIGFYSHSTILDPLQAQYGWSKGIISIAISMYFTVASLSGMIIGNLIDRSGPKPLLIFGATTMGIGFFLLSLVSRLWQFYAIYFFMALGFSCTSLVPINTIITNWFFQKRGVAMGLTMIGLSLGGMVMVPFTVYIISRFSLQTALKILGAILWLIVMPLAVFVIKRAPSVVGQLPDGKKPIHNSSKTSDTRRGSHAIQTRIWRRNEAMKTSAFWFLVISYLFAMIGQNAYLVHQVSFLTQTLGAMKAASVVSITTGASIIGRLFLGPLADRCEKRLVAMGCYLVQSLAILSLSYFRHTAVLYLGTFAFGLTMGGVVMMQSLLIGEYFGAASFGTIYGLAGSFSTVGWAIGPITAGLIFDATHDYRIAFNIFAVTSFAAMMIVFFAKPPASAGQALGAK